MDVLGEGNRDLFVGNEYARTFLVPEAQAKGKVGGSTRNHAEAKRLEAIATEIGRSTAMSTAFK